MNNHEDAYTPITIPKNFSFTENDLLNVWVKIIDRYGMSGFRNPLITYDPSYPILFATASDWKVILNVAFIPDFIDDDKKLKWMEYCPILHEIGHYHISPYDGSTILKYLYIINQEWKECSKEIAFYILNFFTDIVVNWHLTDQYHDDFIDALSQWFKWNDDRTIQSNMDHSSSWRIFVRVHELKWKIKIQEDLPNDEEVFAIALYNLMASGNSREDTLRILTRDGKKFFQNDLNQKSYPMPSPLSSGENSQSQNGDDSDGDEKDQSTSSRHKSIKGKNVTYNDKKVPYDMLITNGDPSEEKLASKISDIPKEAEKREALSEFMKTAGGASALEFLVKMKYSESELEAMRMWIDIRARNLIKFEPKSEKNLANFRNGYKKWKWSDKISDWNIPRSINSNPIIPFPPYAKKLKYKMGYRGEKVKSYKDLMILIDSSGSMSNITPCEFITPYDFAVLSAFSILIAASEKSVKIAAINFSDSALVMQWRKSSIFTIEQIERFLMRSIGSGTIFPTKHIDDLLKKNTDDSVIVVITDAEMSNMEMMLDYFRTISVKRDVFMFYITDGNLPRHLRELKAVGVHVIIVNNYADLPNVVIDKTLRYW